MAEVARVRRAIADAGPDARRRDLVRPDGLEQRVGRMGHVAVDTIAPGRTRGVVGVLGEAGPEAFLAMTLDTRCWAVMAALELIVGRAVVHRVAGQAGHHPAGMARGGEKGGVLAAAGKDRAVVPPAACIEISVFGELGALLRRGILAGELDVVARAVEVLSGGIERTAAGRLHREFVPHDVVAVALAADLGRADRVELRRVDDGRIIFLLAAGRRRSHEAVLVDVRLTGAVAGLAGDAELADLGPELALLVEAGVAAGAVAADAVVVPLGD